MNTQSDFLFVIGITIALSLVIIFILSIVLLFPLLI